MPSRRETFARLGILKPVVEPIVQTAFDLEEDQIWREDLFNAPHGQPWHVGFHASQFPGDNPKACARLALYGLINIPDREPIPRGVRAMGEVGKAIEESIVWRFHRAGILLTDSPNAEVQKGFEDKEHWLTGSPDAIINLPKVNRPHPVEIKSKSSLVIEQMQQGQRSYDPPHRNQILTYTTLAKEDKKFSDIQGGSLYYVSRDNPSETHEFYFDYEPDFIKSGRDKLKTYQQFFLDEELPARPKEWKWTEQPCKWCPVKKFCKQDVKDKVTKLSKSDTIRHAKEVRKNYDYKQTRNEVLERWNATI